MRRVLFLFWTRIRHKRGVLCCATVTKTEGSFVNIQCQPEGVLLQKWKTKQSDFPHNIYIPRWVQCILHALRNACKFCHLVGKYWVCRRQFGSHSDATHSSSDYEGTAQISVACTRVKHPCSTGSVQLGTHFQSRSQTIGGRWQLVSKPETEVWIQPKSNADLSPTDQYHFPLSFSYTCGKERKKSSQHLGKTIVLLCSCWDHNERPAKTRESDLFDSSAVSLYPDNSACSSSVQILNSAKFCLHGCFLYSLVAHLEVSEVSNATLQCTGECQCTLPKGLHLQNWLGNLQLQTAQSSRKKII